MWAGSREHPTRASRSTHGFTIIEIVLVVAVVVLLSVLTAQGLTTMRDSTDTLASMRRVQLRGDRVAYTVHRLVESARKLHVRGTVGNDYLDALDLSRHPMAGGTRLPLPDESRPLDVDDGVLPRTGNILLFVNESEPIPCTTNPTTQTLRYIDVYRMVCVYPQLVDNRRVLNRSPLRPKDLVIWASVLFPNHGQLLAITDPTERARVVSALYAEHGCRRAWNPDLPVDEAFFDLNAVGTVSSTATPSPVIEEDPENSPGGRLVYAKVQLARTDPTSVVRRSKLTADDPATWVPDGFEIKVVGTSAQRRVWMRIVVESQSVTARDVCHAVELIAALRDL
jgi:hypothetical protein